MTELSSRIKEAVKRSGKTQRQIADAVGVSGVSISRYTKGTRTPKASTLPLIAKACGVSQYWLQTGHELYGSHIEMIIDYITDGTDYQYCDNHGILVRCKNCRYWDHEFCTFEGEDHWKHKDGEGYCDQGAKYDK